MRNVPRILVAAAQSGSGKTTLTLGLVAALSRRGLKVQTFKVGPDFLDPTWLAAASGRPCYNLDGWMCGRAYVCDLFERTTRDADVAVIEGVMGLFDGADSTSLSGSSAEIAKWLNAPVLLVVDAHGMARSIAPLVAGFNGFEKGVAIGGVIANQCGSSAHKEILAQALESASLPPLVGGIPKKSMPELPGRHLGLVSAKFGMKPDAPIMNDFAHAVDAFLDLDHIIEIGRSAVPMKDDEKPSEKTSPKPSGSNIRIAVAYDEAFHFYYKDFWDALQTEGGEIIFFSPLRDKSVPEQCDALILGGGYPELHVRKLSENRSMIQGIHDFAESGKVIYAECGGLMYLSEAVMLKDGSRYPMVGILPSETRMLERRKRLGYVEVTLREETLWGKAGEVIRGHEFHYSELTSDIDEKDGWTRVYGMKTRTGHSKSDRNDLTEGFYQKEKKILASYVHLHLASRPETVRHFVAMCKA